MNRESAGWLVAGVAVGLMLTMGAMQQAGRPGRFQVVTGVVPVGSKGEQGAATPCSMLLDTDTGTARIFTFDETRVRWGSPVEVAK